MNSAKHVEFTGVHETGYSAKAPRGLTSVCRAVRSAPLTESQTYIVIMEKRIGTDVQRKLTTRHAVGRVPVNLFLQQKETDSPTSPAPAAWLFAKQ